MKRIGERIGEALEGIPPVREKRERHPIYKEAGGQFVPASPDIRELNDAYSAGYDGPMQGKCVTDNPYERGTALYREWSQGYMTRREELAE